MDWQKQDPGIPLTKNETRGHEREISPARYLVLFTC